MEFLDEKFSKPTFGHAKPGSLEKKPLLDMEQAVGMATALSVDLLEDFIFSIHPFDYHKPKDLGF